MSAPTRRRSSAGPPESEHNGVPQVTTRSRWGALGGHSVTLVGAVLAATISATTLIFILWPGLKPDPKERVGASLATVAFDRNVTLEQYFQREGVTKKADMIRHLQHGEKLGGNGNVFYVKAQIEGFKRSSLHLAWFTYNAEDRYRCLKFRARAPAEVVFQPEAPINTQVAQVWVPTPDLNGTFFVRFELYTGSVLLNFTDSPKFDVRSTNPLSTASC